MTRIASSFLVTTLALSTGCFIEVEAPSITLERKCDRSSPSDCTFRGIPDVIAAGAPPLALANGKHTVDVDLGEDGVLESEYGFGPIALTSNLTLRELVVTTLDGIVLEGMHSLEIRRDDGAVIAGYSPGELGFVRGNELHLDGNQNVNLLDLGMAFSISFVASGRVPTEDWMADLALEVQLIARAE